MSLGSNQSPLVLEARSFPVTLRQDEEEPCRVAFPGCPGLPGPSFLLSHRLCYCLCRDKPLGYTDSFLLAEGVSYPRVRPVGAGLPSQLLAHVHRGVRGFERSGSQGHLSRCISWLLPRVTHLRNQVGMSLRLHSPGTGSRRLRSLL